MPKVLVNHIWRATNDWVKVNHIWRKSNQWAKVNGVWRQPVDTKRLITSDEIDGFQLIYTPARYLKHYLFPDMEFNEDVRYIIDRTGYIDNSLYDDKKKSIIFEYTNSRPEIEGHYVLEGNLYAVLKDDNRIPISSYTDHAATYDPGDIDVKIYGFSSAEIYGPPCLGWNMLFSRINNLAGDIIDNKKVDSFDAYHILPSYKRDEYYHPLAVIGIARNMSDRFNNMVGSHGTLDQTIDKITLNGISMPFQIIIYKT